FDALDAGRRRERRDETDALVDVLRAPLERDARPAYLLLDARAAAGIEHLGVGGAECGLDAQYANDANARTQPELAALLCAHGRVRADHLVAVEAAESELVAVARQEALALELR